MCLGLCLYKRFANDHIQGLNDFIFIEYIIRYFKIPRVQSLISMRPYYMISFTVFGCEFVLGPKVTFRSKHCLSWALIKDLIPEASGHSSKLPSVCQSSGVTLEGCEKGLQKPTHELTAQSPVKIQVFQKCFLLLIKLKSFDVTTTKTLIKDKKNL